jgi:hypothetical protein
MQLICSVGQDSGDGEGHRDTVMHGARVSEPDGATYWRTPSTASTRQDQEQIEALREDKTVASQAGCCHRRIDRDFGNQRSVHTVIHHAMILLTLYLLSVS